MNNEKTRRDFQALYNKQNKTMISGRRKTKDCDLYNQLGFLPGSTSQSTLKGKKFQGEYISHTYRNGRSGKQKWLEFANPSITEDGATKRKSFRNLHRSLLEWLHAHKDTCRGGKKKLNIPRAHTELGKCLISI